MPTLTTMILAHLQQPSIWSGSHLLWSFLVCQMPLCLYGFFVYLDPYFVPTALLICMENTFWSISGDSNIMDLFKKSFTLYVESGMKRKMEADLDILLLGNQDGHPRLVTKEFKANFCKVIIENSSYLQVCKFSLFSYSMYPSLITFFFHLNTVHPGDQAFELELEQSFC